MREGDPVPGCGVKSSPATGRQGALRWTHSVSVNEHLVRRFQSLKMALTVILSFASTYTVD